MLVIVQKSDNHMREILQMTQPIVKEYCAKHGYIYYEDNEPIDTSRSPRWIKHPALYRAMITFHEADWVLWLDADTIIMNMKFAIEPYLKKDITVQPFTVKRTYAIDRTTMGLLFRYVPEGAIMREFHSGVFAVKNTEWSKRFIMDLYSDHRFTVPFRSPASESEELAFTLKIEEIEDFDDHIFLAQQGLLYTAPDIMCLDRDILNVPIYKPGHWLIHVAVMGKQNKIRLIRDIINDKL